MIIGVAVRYIYIYIFNSSTLKIGNRKSFRNVGNFLPDYIALQTHAVFTPVLTSGLLSEVLPLQMQL
jgi:hypothetical protein